MPLYFQYNGDQQSYGLTFLLRLGVWDSENLLYFCNHKQMSGRIMKIEKEKRGDFRRKKKKKDGCPLGFG